jgi:hypothetical protein
MIPNLDNCPICGTKGKVKWEPDEGVFECPNCSSIFSKFGIVAEARKEVPEHWN